MPTSALTTRFRAIPAWRRRELGERTRSASRLALSAAECINRDAVTLRATRAAHIANEVIDEILDEDRTYTTPESVEKEAIMASKKKTTTTPKSSTKSAASAKKGSAKKGASAKGEKKEKAAKTAKGDKPFEHDARIPPVGTVIEKKDRHGEVRCSVTVKADGFDYNGTHFTSISSAALAAMKDLGLTNSTVNGFIFFGLTKPEKKEKAATA